MRLEHKIAVVTGSASGIGQACARRFEQEGARVYGMDLAGSPPCDVSCFDQVAAAAQRILAEAGPPHVLLHSAAPSAFARTVETTEADFERIMRVNVLGAINLVKAFDAHLERGASIVLLASITGLVGAPGQSAYAASKGALVTLARTLALEMAERGIRVNSVCPASVDTPRLQGSFDRHPDPALARERNILRHPLGRLGTPDDVANLALFLASDEASWITGGTYVIDGGASINRS